MKKITALAVTVALLLSALCLFTFSATADAGYTVTATEAIAVTLDADASTDAPLVVTGASVATDAAIVSTCQFLVKVAPASGTEVREYTLIIDGKENTKAISSTYNAGSNGATLFITLPEGQYNEVIARGKDTDGKTYDVIKLVNLTVTAAVNEVSEEGIPVDYSPVWTVLPKDMAKSATAMTVTDEGGYAHMACTSTGDPNYSFIQGTRTKIGRFLLVKYSNNSIVPRMQIYMAQEAGIASDTNMIEFEIAANGSGWTYAVVDMSKNAFYDKDTQEVCHFRFDPLESRNVNGGAYKFDGTESIDVAYVMGFTTRAGVEGYLAAHELHEVTKTAVLRESQLTAVDGGYTYADKLGDVYPVTANEDGTYSYTFTTQDVRIPCDTTPKTLLDGSRLVSTGNCMEAVKDALTGIVTLTATGADPFYLVSGAPLQAARYMAVKYRTTVEDKMEFFTSTDGAGPEGGKSFVVPMVCDGNWQTAVIDLSAFSYIDNTTYSLNFLRYDFLVGSSEGSVDVEFIAFFDSEDAAYLYVHQYKTYTVTFSANNQVVEKVVFEAGATSVKEPAVPEKEGYTGVWASYTMADKNFTVKAIYTAIEEPTEEVTETPTEAPTDEATVAPDTDGEPTACETVPATEQDNTTVADTAPDATEADGTTDGTTADGTDTQATENGCASAITGLAVLMVAAAVAVVVKKKD